MSNKQHIIIAGSTGLIGSCLINKTLQHKQVEHVISLSRRV